jgi:hypothetical protein
MEPAAFCITCQTYLPIEAFYPKALSSCRSCTKAQARATAAKALQRPAYRMLTAARHHERLMGNRLSMTESQAGALLEVYGNRSVTGSDGGKLVLARLVLEERLILQNAVLLTKLEARRHRAGLRILTEEHQKMAKDLAARAAVIEQKAE